MCVRKSGAPLISVSRECTDVSTRNLPVAKIRRDDETILRIPEMLSEGFSIGFLFPCGDASNHDWDNLDLTQPSGPLDHLVGVGKMHLDGVFIFVDVDAHPLEEIRAVEGLEGFRVEREVAERSLVCLAC